MLGNARPAYVAPVGAGAGAGNGARTPPRPTRSYPEPAAYTPKHLAEKILKSKAAVEGERKQVRVMFADVCESMTLAESVDPEAWHSILDGFFSILSNGIERRTAFTKRRPRIHSSYGIARLAGGRLHECAGVVSTWPGAR